MFQLPEWLDSYLTFHHKQRRGAIAVLLIIGITIGINIFLRVQHRKFVQKDILTFGPSIVEFNAKTEAIDDDYSDQSNADWPTRSNSMWEDGERFSFDPNALDSAGWVRLGFSPKQSASIVRYRSKGAVFRSPADLLRLYMMDSTRYLDLLPYIVIHPQPERSVASDFSSYKRSAPIRVDINRADTIELATLKGIGPAFARRIFKYRERLGGFRSTNQLYEVFGMDSARMQGFLEQITLDTSSFSYININTADFKQLIRLPYFNKNQVNAILNYRNQHGNFRTLSDLQRIHLITPETFAKIAPHLTTEHPK